MIRLTKRCNDFIERNCQHPQNLQGEMPCFNCVDRTKCNSDLIARLVEYEDTGLAPEQINKLKNHNADVGKMVSAAIRKVATRVAESASQGWTKSIEKIAEETEAEYERKFV